MRKLLLPLLILALLAIGCDRDNPIFPGYDTDGLYTGWVYIDNPGMGFNRSFYAELRIYDNGYDARLWDDYGRVFDSDHVDYNYWTDELDVYFRVIETRWSPDCGHEVYDWEMKMNGNITSSDRYRGELEGDIDPEDYHSDHCHLDYNPPPRHVGTFDLSRTYNSWDY